MENNNIKRNKIVNEMIEKANRADAEAKTLESVKDSKTEEKSLFSQNELFEKIMEQPPKLQQMNERDLSGILMRIVGDRLVYNETKKTWMYYDSKRWSYAAGDEMMNRVAKDFSRALQKFASECDIESEEGKAFRKIANQYSSRRKRETLVKDAKSEIIRKSSDFDTDDNLLNLQNGTLNLETMEFKDHSSTDMLSLIAGADYQPDIRCERWEQFINEITAGNKDLSTALQLMAGLSLTAITKEECFFLLLGEGTRNGKSTFISTLSCILGDYAVTLPIEILAVRRMDGTDKANDALARLENKRFIPSSEPPKGFTLDTSRLKLITGGDTLVARSLHEKNKEFTPKGKIVIHANHPLLYSDTTIYDSDRLYLIPFNVHFAEDGENKPDRNLKELFQQPENCAGILNWALEGLELYKKYGLIRPMTVRKAIQDSRKDADLLSRFLEQGTEPDEYALPITDFYKSYCMWITSQGLTNIPTKTLVIANLDKLGLVAKTGTIKHPATGESVTRKNVIPHRKIKFNEFYEEE